MSFRYGGLFSGIGMLEMACEKLGGEAAFMVEQDEFCQKVLRKRFPGVPLHSDVKEVGQRNLPAVDVLVGGFP